MRLEPLAAETVVPVPGLEDVTARVVAHFEAGSESAFEAGHEVFDYLRAADVPAMKARDAKRHRRTVLRSIASGAGCSTNCIVQHVEVWAAFGEEGIRAQDRAWHFHRAALLAAKRTKRPPADVLEEALSKGWSVADLNTLGRSEATARRLVAVCSTCGLKVRLDAPRGTVAADFVQALHCPVCVENPHESPTVLGVLT